MEPNHGVVRATGAVIFHLPRHATFVAAALRRGRAAVVQRGAAGYSPRALRSSDVTGSDETARHALACGAGGGGRAMKRHGSTRCFVGPSLRGTAVTGLSSRRAAGPLWALGLAIGLLVGCQADPQASQRVSTDLGLEHTRAPDGLALAPEADVAPGDGTAVPQPPSAVPKSLLAETWLAHIRDDLLPFWTSSEALGEPLGNFPTFRGMDGSLQGPSERRPRMLSRQIFGLAVGFMMTGDVALLEAALHGVHWLAEHALDTEYGGFHSILDKAGNPVGSEPKTAQDTAYAALGPAMVAFITRDPTALSLVDAARQVLFGPDGFFDVSSGMLHDAMTPDLGAPVDLFGDGGVELVAQLDVITALLLHAERAVSQPQRAEVRSQLATLGQALLNFVADDMVWGVDAAVGSYGGRHSDFGHAAKTVWALHLIDARVPNPVFRQVVEGLGPKLLARAFDPSYGRWAKRPLSDSSVEYGSDWWGAIALDQLEATIAVDDARLAQAAGNFLTDYVDRSRTVRELVPSVGRDGAWVWPWSDEDTAKCNDWKNGYHAAEHALVMYLMAHARRGSPATLYFARALPEARDESLSYQPYLFDGVQLSERVSGELSLLGQRFTGVEVDFQVLPPSH